MDVIPDFVCDDASNKSCSDQNDQKDDVDVRAKKRKAPQKRQSILKKTKGGTVTGANHGARAKLLAAASTVPDKSERTKRVSFKNQYQRMMSFWKLFSVDILSILLMFVSRISQLERELSMMSLILLTMIFPTVAIVIATTTVFIFRLKGRKIEDYTGQTNPLQPCQEFVLVRKVRNEVTFKRMTPRRQKKCEVRRERMETHHRKRMYLQ